MNKIKIHLEAERQSHSLQQTKWKLLTVDIEASEIGHFLITVNQSYDQVRKQSTWKNLFLVICCTLATVTTSGGASQVSAQAVCSLDNHL